MESGISTRRDESSYISDCTVETDQLALIPDDYIDVNAEKIRIYKDMDSAGEGKQLDRIHSMMEDRFGKMPPEVERLFDIVRIRNIAASLGFEKVIVKNGIMICFFISNPLSPFYKSGEFSKTLERISLPDNAKYYELKQSNDRLKIVCRNVDGTSRALELLRKIK